MNRVRSRATRLASFLVVIAAIPVFLVAHHVNALVVWGYAAMTTQSQVTQDCPTGKVPAQVAFTLMTESGALPADLKKEDFSLKVNGDLTEVSKLELQTGSPLDLFLLIDVSVSQEESLPTTKLAAKGVISS